MLLRYSKFQSLIINTRNYLCQQRKPHMKLSRQRRAHKHQRMGPLNLKMKLKLKPEWIKPKLKLMIRPNQQALKKYGMLNLQTLHMKCLWNPNKSLINKPTPSSLLEPLNSSRYLRIGKWLMKLLDRLLEIQNHKCPNRKLSIRASNRTKRFKLKDINCLLNWVSH